MRKSIWRTRKFRNIARTLQKSRAELADGEDEELVSRRNSPDHTVRYREHGMNYVKKTTGRFSIAPLTVNLHSAMCS